MVTVNHLVRCETRIPRFGLCWHNLFSHVRVLRFCDGVNVITIMAFFPSDVVGVWYISNLLPAICFGFGWGRARVGQILLMPKTLGSNLAVRNDCESEQNSMNRQKNVLTVGRDSLSARATGTGVCFDFYLLFKPESPRYRSYLILTILNDMLEVELLS